MIKRRDVAGDLRFGFKALLRLAVALEHLLRLVLDHPVDEQHRVHLRVAAHRLRAVDAGGGVVVHALSSRRRPLATPRRGERQLQNSYSELAKELTLSQLTCEWHSLRQRSKHDAIRQKFTNFTMFIFIVLRLRGTNRSLKKFLSKV